MTAGNAVVRRIAGLAHDLLGTHFDGLQQTTADGIVSISRFHFDADTRRLGCLIGTLLEDESEVNWQPMIVDGTHWYLGTGTGTENSPESLDDFLGRIDEMEWVVVTGTGVASTIVGVLYWLLGAVDASATRPPDETSSDGLSWFGVTVSVSEAIAQAEAMTDAGVREGFDQAGVTQDHVQLQVGLDGDRIAAVLWSDPPMIFADHRFWPAERPRAVPMPDAAEQRSFGDYFALLGHRNPLTRDAE